MQKKYQIFVSSTYSDLVDERQDALKSILDTGHIPSGMEGFFAVDKEQLSYIKRIIDECDYYVLIIAGRYGTLDDAGISYTEREYDYAVSKGIPVLAFIHNDVENLVSSKVENDKNSIDKLEAFRKKVSQKRLVSFWNIRPDLKANIIISLAKAINEVPRVGWMRGNTVASEEILSQINTLRNETEVLRAENSQLKDGLKPKIENIAPLDGLMELHYSYTGTSFTIRKSFELSWETIFKIIGPSFYSPHTATTVTSSLKTYITDEIHNGSYLKYLAIKDSDIDTIKIQLAAYGFLEIYQANSAGGGVMEYLQLTEIGKRTLMELKTIKAAKSN